VGEAAHPGPTLVIRRRPPVCRVGTSLKCTPHQATLQTTPTLPPTDKCSVGAKATGAAARKAVGAENSMVAAAVEADAVKAAEEVNVTAEAAEGAVNCTNKHEPAVPVQLEQLVQVQQWELRGQQVLIAKLVKQMAGLEAEQLSWYVHQPHCRCMLCVLQLQQHSRAQDCHRKVQQLPRPRAATEQQQHTCEQQRVHQAEQQRVRQAEQQRVQQAEQQAEQQKAEQEQQHEQAEQQRVEQQQAEQQLQTEQVDQQQAEQQQAEQQQAEWQQQQKVEQQQQQQPCEHRAEQEQQQPFEHSDNKGVLPAAQEQTAEADEGTDMLWSLFEEPKRKRGLRRSQRLEQQRQRQQLKPGGGNMNKGKDTGRAEAGNRQRARPGATLFQQMQADLVRAEQHLRRAQVKTEVSGLEAGLATATAELLGEQEAEMSVESERQRVKQLRRALHTVKVFARRSANIRMQMRSQMHRNLKGGGASDSSRILRSWVRDDQLHVITVAQQSEAVINNWSGAYMLNSAVKQWSLWRAARVHTQVQCEAAQLKHRLLWFHRRVLQVRLNRFSRQHVLSLVKLWRHRAAAMIRLHRPHTNYDCHYLECHFYRPPSVLYVTGHRIEHACILCDKPNLVAKFQIAADRVWSAALQLGVRAMNRTYFNQFRSKFIAHDRAAFTLFAYIFCNQCWSMAHIIHWELFATWACVREWRRNSRLASDQFKERRGGCCER
jgi:hypothetical protein